MQVFEKRKKSLTAEKRTNKLNSHMTPSLEIKPGPHWWEASALTIAPPLLSTIMNRENLENNASAANVSWTCGLLQS